MEYYYEQILAGLSKLPVEGTPGSMVIFGDKAQPVFTGSQPGEVFLAAAEYGNGRVFVSAHDCYLTWFGQTNGLKKQFIDNVKNWLTRGAYLNDSEIGDMNDFSDFNCNFEKYRLIKWHHNKQLSADMQMKVLSYLARGGALFCASTPWGYLQIYNSKTLNDMDLYVFLKDFIGIIYTDGYVSVPTEIPIEQNQARCSNLNTALNEVKCDIGKLSRYCSTIDTGLDILQKEELVDDSFMKQMMNKIVCKCREKNFPLSPSEKKPVCDSEHKSMMKLMCTCIMNLKGIKASNITEFPGDFKEDPFLFENVILSLDTKFNERLSTGYYLPAGVEMIVEVVSGDVKGWSIRIGAHTDDLTNCDEYKRWPVVTISKQLEKAFSICSPFGGLVYFESPHESSITIKLTNVVESPFIDKMKPDTIHSWRHRKSAPGLWAEIAGEHVIITCPSECVRGFETAEKVLEITDFWDNVIKCHHKLRGTDPKMYRRERVVNDKQPSAGYMHSGYPIVTHLDVCEKTCNECMFDINNLRKNGSWGLFHEFGHNMQRGEWTFDGCGEVTVNLFSMHAMKFVIGKDVLQQPWILDQKRHFRPYFNKNPTYDDWKENCHIALMTFVQLIKYFGWEPMRKFLHVYENDIQTGQNLPRSNQDKIDQWVLRYSKLIGKNIRPQFQLWGLPVSESVNQNLRALPEWCPKQDIYPDPMNFFNNP